MAFISWDIDTNLTVGAEGFHIYVDGVLNSDVPVDARFAEVSFSGNSAECTVTLYLKSIESTESIATTLLNIEPLVPPFDGGTQPRFGKISVQRSQDIRAYYNPERLFNGTTSAPTMYTYDGNKQRDWFLRVEISFLYPRAVNAIKYLTHNSGLGAYNDYNLYPNENINVYGSNDDTLGTLIYTDAFVEVADQPAATEVQGSFSEVSYKKYTIEMTGFNSSSNGYTSRIPWYNVLLYKQL